MATLAWPPKDPSEVLDYTIDWTARLNGDTIVTSVWANTVGDGVLILNSSSFSTTMTKVWLSGGTIGLTYTWVNTITTTRGDTMLESVSIQMRYK